LSELSKLRGITIRIRFVCGAYIVVVVVIVVVVAITVIVIIATNESTGT